GQREDRRDRAQSARPRSFGPEHGRRLSQQCFRGARGGGRLLAIVTRQRGGMLSAMRAWRVLAAFVVFGFPFAAVEGAVALVGRSLANARLEEIPMRRRDGNEIV